MTITTKLNLNAIIVAIVVCLLAGTGIVSLNLVKGKLSHLIKKSTPFQVRTTELQQRIQETVASLVKVGTAENQEEFTQAKTMLGESLNEVKKTQDALASLSEQKSDIHEELSRTTGQLVAITDSRLKAEANVSGANQIISARSKGMATTLRELDVRIAALQMTNTRGFAKSLGVSKGTTVKRLNLESMRASLDQLQLLLATLPAAKDRKQVIVLKSRLNGIVDNFLENSTVRESNEFTAAGKVIKQKINEILSHHAQVMKQPDDANRLKLDQMITESREQNIGSLIASFDVAVDRASHDSSVASNAQEAAFRQSNISTEILAGNAALVAAGLTLDGISTRLFIASSADEITRLETEMTKVFAKIDSSEKQLEKALATVKATSELKLLKKAEASLRDMRGLLTGGEGIIAKVRNQLTLKLEAAKANEAIKATVQRYVEKGRAETLAAHQEQENSAVGVNRIVRLSVSAIGAVGGATLIFTVIFSIMIGRSITKPLNKTLEAITIVEGGDLTHRIGYENKDELGQLSSRFNRFVEKFQTVISQVIGDADRVASASTEFLQTSVLMVKGSEEVVAQAGSVATASEEMAATANNIAQNCHLAAENAQRANTTASSGSVVVNNTVHVMEKIAIRVNETAKTVERLGASSDQIGEIIRTIHYIADQTNLLALNAAIEAARAGEQGRGFAVVADEIRVLAEKTSIATKEIGDMIKAIQNETRYAVAGMEEGVKEVESGTMEAAKSGEALQAILEQINDVTIQVNQIATAAEEQTATTTEISNNMVNITEVVHKTARGAEETSLAAKDLSKMSEKLRQMVTQFKVT
ncbi:MAG: methyl-accepting chemotaxis protein [Pedobacter sp.]